MIQSDAIIIRNGLLDRVKQLPFFEDVMRFSRTKTRMIQGEQFPYFGCYIIGEHLTPDGSANHAQPRYRNELRIGFSYCILENDDELAEDRLDAAYLALMTGIFHDQSWHKFGTNELGEPVYIEAVPKVMRYHRYGAETLSQESPIAELAVEWTCQYRIEISPIIPDDFKRMLVETRPIDNPDAPVIRQKILVDAEP